MDEDGLSTPNTQEKTPVHEKKRLRGGSSPTGTDTDPPVAYPSEIADILTAIEQRLTAMDNRVALIEIIHKEFNALRESLEFSQSQISDLANKNKTLEKTVALLSTQLTSVSAENKTMRESILDLQARSMRDNVVFSGIPERASENPEKTIKDFMVTQLKLPLDTVSQISLDRVHRLGATKPDSKRPRPIVAKFSNFKEKQLVQRQGRQLKGTDFGLNDQFPREIMLRR